MSALNDFSETVTFARDNPELTGKIEAVMLHVGEGAIETAKTAYFLLGQFELANRSCSRSCQVSLLSVYGHLEVFPLRRLRVGLVGVS